MYGERHFAGPSSKPKNTKSPTGTSKRIQAGLSRLCSKLVGSSGYRIGGHSLVRAVNLHLHATVLAASRASVAFLGRLLGTETYDVDAVQRNVVLGHQVVDYRVREPLAKGIVVLDRANLIREAFDGYHEALQAALVGDHFIEGS